VSEIFYPEFKDLFSKLINSLTGKYVAVLGHARPDGDCIGSQVALARVLRSAGINAVCVNADPIPRRLQYLTKEESFLNYEDILKQKISYAAIYVDCADHARVGERLKVQFPKVEACIDHHMSNRSYASVNIVDSHSAATCEILAGMFFDLGLTVDAITAQALFTGILTDTGQFRFNSTSRRCFVLSGELVARGASPVQAGYELFSRESLGKMNLLKRFLNSLEMHCSGKVCIGILPVGIFQETSTSAEDTEGLVDYARSIDGVRVGVLVEEKSGGGRKASLRSDDPRYRLDLVAAQFNGGGHACAAGLNLPAEDSKDFIMRLVDALAIRIDEVEKQNNP
jgi:bifunctional oligoribonuclease and PAP phosphatase NrnA